MSAIDTDAYTTPFSATKTIHRSPYAALDPLRPENSQKGKLVLITGAGTGIGAAMALEWAKAGAAGIALAGRRVNKLEEVVAQVKAINKDAVTLTVATDVSNEGDVANLFSQIQMEFKRHPDVVISNAGYLETPGPVGTGSASDWWKSLEINLRGYMLVLQAYLKSQGDNITGTIIVTSSGMGGLTTPNLSAYSIAKLGQQKLTEFAVVDHPTLRAFTIHPGIIVTDLADPSIYPFALDDVKLAGQLTLYLAQPRADYLNGSFLSVNWDVTELEAHQEVIKAKSPFKTSWLPVLPAEGGSGLAGLTV